MSDELDPMRAHVSTVMGEYNTLFGIPPSLLQPGPANTSQAVTAYLQPAIDQMEQRREKYRQQFLEAITGKHSAKEVEPGVWEHTFTPNNGRQWYWQIDTTGLTEDIPFGKPTQKSFGQIYRQWKRSVQARKRARRQHRATFRRRKRGLA